jgi:hypothetical protein
MAEETFGPFRRWCWRPPRPHGETIAGRTVSSLELFFTQIGVLALLAVFIADAADGSGPAFAIVYATFLAVVTWLFSTVRVRSVRTSSSSRRKRAGT